MNEDAWIYFEDHHWERRYRGRLLKVRPNSRFYVATVDDRWNGSVFTDPCEAMVWAERAAEVAQ